MDSISSTSGSQNYCPNCSESSQPLLAQQNTFTKLNRAGGSAADTFTFSPESIKLSSEKNSADSRLVEETDSPAQIDTKNEEKATNFQNLRQEEFLEIQKLKARDIEVRSHEQAHLAAAGRYAAGGASFSYVTGRDGKRYADGGSVPIDTGREKTPEATIQKMRTIKRAALAPASPSAADRQIAAQAARTESQAIRQIQSEQAKSSAETRNVSISTDPSQNHVSDKSTTETSLKHKHNDNPQAAVQQDTTSIHEMVSGSNYARRVMASSYRTMAAFAQ